MSYASNDQQTFVVAADHKRNRLDTGFAIRSVAIQNLCVLANIVVTDDAGRGFSVAPGGVIVSNLPAVALNVISDVIEQGGTCIIVVYAYEQVPSGNGGPISGGVTITAPVTISGIVSVSGNVSIVGTVTIAGSVNATITNSFINAAITNASLTVTDSLVETNTTVISGLLPKNVAAFVNAINGTFTQAIVNAITAFALQLTLTDGFLDVFYTSSGQSIFLMRQFAMYPTANNNNGLERIFTAPIPAGSTISVRTSNTLSTLGGILKW